MTTFVFACFFYKRETRRCNIVHNFKVIREDLPFRGRFFG